MVDSIITCDDPALADAVLIGVPYEHGASFGGGASRGPEAIIACLDRQIEMFERHTRTEPAYRYRIAQTMLERVTTMAPDEMVALVAATVARQAGFVVVLGGSHAVSIGALQGHAARLPAHDVTVVQIDAHLDMRADDSDYNDHDPSPLAHSCVMRRVHEMGFRTCSIGIRAYGRDEALYAREHGLPVFEWGRGALPSIDTIMAAIATERVYVTIDVDGFDPAVAPATGTPVPGGIAWNDGMALIRALFEAKDVVGADIVEVAPLSGSGLTEYAAAQLCYDMVAYRLLKRDGALAFL